MTRPLGAEARGALFMLASGTIFTLGFAGLVPLMGPLAAAANEVTTGSPTDTVPFSRWSKLAMTVQSMVSLLVGALVVARAVNALGS